MIRAPVPRLRESFSWLLGVSTRQTARARAKRAGWAGAGVVPKSPKGEMARAREFMAHTMAERFHQGLGGQLIEGQASSENDNGAGDAIVCRSRLGGMLNYYHRQAT
jgi:hypothetical protein